MSCWNDGFVISAVCVVYSLCVRAILHPCVFMPSCMCVSIWVFGDYNIYNVLPVLWLQWAWSSGPAPPVCRCRGSASSQRPSPAPPAARPWRWCDCAAASSSGADLALTPHLTLHPYDYLYQRHRQPEDISIMQVYVCIVNVHVKKLLNVSILLYSHIL